MRPAVLVILAALLCSPAQGMPDSTRPLPLHDGDLQGHAASDGTHVLAFSGGRVVAVDGGTGAVLWSLVEPQAQDGFAVAAGGGLACVGYTRSQGGFLACHRLATGDPAWSSAIDQAPYRAAWDGGLFVGLADGSVRRHDAQGAVVWQTAAEPGSAGIHALTAGGGRVFASLLHGTTQTQPALGSHPDDRVLVLDAATGSVQARLATRLQDGSTPSAYSLLWDGSGLAAGLNGGWTVRFDATGAIAASQQATHGLAITALAATPQGIATGALRGALTLHGAGLAPVWETARATDAGHTIGLAYDAGSAQLVSAHRTGILLAGPLTPAATVLVHAPKAASVWRQDVPAEVSLARQGLEAAVPLRLDWVRPDGSTLNAWQGPVTVGPNAQPTLRDVPIAGIADGTGYRLQARLDDPLGARTSLSGPIAIDRSPPRLLSLEPADGAVLDHSPASVRATWIDVTSGIDDGHGTIALGGASVTVERTGGQLRAVPTSPLADGRHTATVHVRDRAGNEAQRTWSFTVDAAPPSVRDARVATAGPNYLQVSWATDEPAHCVASAATPAFEGTPAGGLVLQHTAWLSPLPADRDVTVRILCRDGSGNVAAPATVAARTRPATGSPPTLRVDLDPVTAVAGWSAVAVQVLASVQGTGDAFVSVDGGPAQPLASPWTAPEGSHALAVVAIGPGGASAVWKATVRVDTVPPSAPVPTTGLSTTGILEVSWTGAQDDGVPVPTVRVEAQVDGRWSAQTDLAGALGEGAVRALPGQASYRLVAVDRAGHETPSEPFTVTAPASTLARFEAVLRSAREMRVGLPVQVDVAGAPAEPTARLVQDGREVARVPHPDRLGDGRWAFTIGTGGLAPGPLTVQVLVAGEPAQALQVELLGSSAAGTETVGVKVKDTPSAGAAPALLLLALAAALRRRPRPGVPQGL